MSMPIIVNDLQLDKKRWNKNRYYKGKMKKLIHLATDCSLQCVTQCQSQCQYSVTSLDTYLIFQLRAEKGGKMCYLQANMESPEH